MAFVLTKTEGLDEISRTRISREAQAMGRLVLHPHIVTVFEPGDVLVVNESSTLPASLSAEGPMGAFSRRGSLLGF